MKKLELNALGVEEMSAGEAKEVNGGLSPYQNSWGNESDGVDALVSFFEGIFHGFLKKQ